MTKLQISLYVPGMAFDGKTVEERSLGGSESAAFYVARSLAALGDHVLVFSNTDRPGYYDDVHYRPLGEWQQYSRFSPHDVSVCQRLPETFANPVNAKLNVLWCHDLAQARQASSVRGVLWNIDLVAVLSEYMLNLYREIYGLKDADLFLTRNGVDLKMFDAVDGAQRDPNKLMFTSRPERGLDVMLDILPKILEQEPNVVLHVATYDNQVGHLAQFYGECEARIRNFGERCKWLGMLRKEELFEHYATAAALVYPTPSPTQKVFAEISCITAMEAMAAGLPVISSDRGALPETLARGAGVLLPGDPWSEEYQSAFVENVVGVIRNPAAWDQMSEIGREAAQALDWSGVAEQWHERFERAILENNTDEERLARWFYRRSDIEAMRRVLKDKPNGFCPDLRMLDTAHYSFFDSEFGVQKHYAETIGPFYDAEIQKQVDLGKDFSPLFRETQEARFHYFVRFLNETPGAKKIVDYGCGHGWCDVWLHNATGCEIVGLDIEEAAIKWSNHWADNHARNRSALTFITGDHTTEPGEHFMAHDILLISEVLEHVWNPAAVVDAMETWVKDGGRVLITVPFGPQEYPDYNRLPFRNHVREFSAHDLYDLFGKKKNFECNTLAHQPCSVTGEATGYYICSWTSSGIPSGEIDWNRKLRLQRPTQTVSACLMAGGDKAAECLHWTLKSLRPIVNEIIIANCGMDDETLRIAQEYGARIVASKDPRTHGFETGRNDSLDAARMDWVFWIDTDEALVAPQNLLKYCRESHYFGYGIRQHHFAVDTKFEPDMPIRLFRNRPYEGKEVRFYGMIHEHPELEMNKGINPVIILSDVNIAHVGYLTESIRIDRFGRNFPLLQADIAKYPDRKLQRYFIMRDNMMLCMYEARKNGGQITEPMRERARETIVIYREFFLGQHDLLNIDPMQYYTNAMEICGEGIDVSIDLAVARDGQGDQINGTKYRFASVEEATTELAWRLKQKMTPFVNENW